MLALVTRWLFRPPLSVAVTISVALLGLGALVRIAAFPAAVVASDDLIALAIFVVIVVVFEQFAVVGVHVGRHWAIKIAAALTRDRRN